LDEADYLLGKKDVILRTTHPGGGSSYAISYKPQKTVESYSGGDKPQILCIGHYHKMGYFEERNIHVVLVPSCQNQTPFMRKRQLKSVVGAVIIEFNVSEDGSVNRFKPEFLKCFK